VVGGNATVQVSEQLLQVLAEVVDRKLAAIRLESEHRELVRAGCTPEAEVDAAGVEAAEHAEALGHPEGAVVGKHHAAAAHPDALRDGADGGDQDLGRVADEHRRAVVLGHPVAVVAELLGVTGEVDRVVQGHGPARG
jgi:hypothetical protein